MKLNVYSILDQATAAYMRPFYLQSDNQALRMFSDIILDESHEIAKHPEDYVLCRIGIWDDQTAETTPETVSTLITGLEARARVLEARAQLGESSEGVERYGREIMPGGVVNNG